MIDFFLAGFEVDSPWRLVALLGALFALAWAATLLSIYNQEKKIPSAMKVWRTMIWRLYHFPSSLLSRIKSSPRRAKQGLLQAKYRLIHSIAKRVLPSVSYSKKSKSRSPLINYLNAHRLPLEDSLLFEVSGNANPKKMPLAEALLLAPHQTTFSFSPSHVEKRFSKGKWKAYEVHQGAVRIWAVSKRELKHASFKGELHRTKKGIYILVK